MIGLLLVVVALWAWALLLLARKLTGWPRRLYWRHRNPAMRAAVKSENAAIERAAWLLLWGIR